MSDDADAKLMVYNYDTLAVTGPTDGVIEVALNRPKKLNAMNETFWRDLTACMDQISVDSNVRCAVITGGTSRIFSAGLDIMGSSSSLGAGGDVGRRALNMHDTIKLPQDAISSIEECKKPVIVALHNAVIGGGIDLACAADIRYCTKDTVFIIAEVNVGLAADIGTLQRMPKKIGNDSVMRELALTGRKMGADEAFKLGLVGRIEEDQAACIKAAHETAAIIASKSPIAVVGTKMSLNYSMDHTNAEGLDHIRWWNMSMLQSEDLMVAMMAQRSKEKATFSKL